MGLNIKNERVHALAKRAAQVTGKTQTGAIEEALERLLEAHEVDPEMAGLQSRVDLVWEVARAYREMPGDADREIRAVEDLFDDASGMPK